MSEIRFWCWNLDSLEGFAKPLKFVYWEVWEQQEQQIVAALERLGSLGSSNDISSKGTVSLSCLCHHPFCPAINKKPLHFRRENKPFSPASSKRTHCGIRISYRLNIKKEVQLLLLWGAVTDTQPASLPRSVSMTRPHGPGPFPGYLASVMLLSLSSFVILGPSISCK